MKMEANHVAEGADRQKQQPTQTPQQQKQQQRPKQQLQKQESDGRRDQGGKKIQRGENKLQKMKKRKITQQQRMYALPFEAPQGDLDRKTSACQMRQNCLI